MQKQCHFPGFHAQLFTIALLLAANSTAQQTSSTLVGSVLDQSGGTVPNATITATETRTGVSRSTVTTADGVYNLPYLTPGTYRVEISAQGFKKVVRENVELSVSSTVRVDVSLEPGAVTETVTVTAEAPALQTDRAEVARNFTTQNVTELPLGESQLSGAGGTGRGCHSADRGLYTIGGPAGHHVLPRERAGKFGQ